MNSEELMSYDAAWRLRRDALGRDSIRMRDGILLTMREGLDVDNSETLCRMLNYYNALIEAVKESM